MSGATPLRIFRHFASGTEWEADKEKIAAAREWLQKFNAETIPRNIGDVTFSRSSGPGGQNVNKCAEPRRPVIPSLMPMAESIPRPP